MLSPDSSIPSRTINSCASSTGKSQLARADLRQLPSRPQARHTDRRIRARGPGADARCQAAARSHARSSEVNARSRPCRGRRARPLPDDRTPPDRPSARQPLSRPAHPGRQGTKAPGLRDPRRAARRPSPGASTTAPGRRRPNRASAKSPAPGTLGTPRAQQRRLAVANRRVKHRQGGPADVIEQLKPARPAQRPGVNAGRRGFELRATCRLGGTVSAICVLTPMPPRG